MFENTAKQAASRVDSDGLGLDPLTVITLITTLMPLLASCFSKNDSPDPKQASDKFRKAWSDHPRTLRNRIRHQVKKKAKEDGTKLSKEQIDAVTDGIIEEALETSAEEMARLLAE